MLTSAAATTSITSMLLVGLTTGSAFLSVVLVLTFMSKEISLSVPKRTDRLVDTLNAVLIPLVFAFLTIFVLEAAKVVG